MLGGQIRDARLRSSVSGLVILVLLVAIPSSSMTTHASLSSIVVLSLSEPVPRPVQDVGVGEPSYRSPESCEGNVAAVKACALQQVAPEGPAQTDGAYWTNLTLASAPLGLMGASMAYDAADGYVILFGGNLYGYGPTNFTWAFQSGVWTNITTTAGPAPTPRLDMALTYDAADGYLVGFGGFTDGSSCLPSSTTTICNDTWIFSGGKWTPLSVASPPPATYYWPEMTYDAADASVLLFGGSANYTYTFHAGVWTQEVQSDGDPLSGPDPRVGFGLAYDPQMNAPILFGGESPFFSQSPTAGFNDTWVFSDGNWSNVSSTLTGTPIPWEGFQMVYDSTTGGLLLFGGSQNPGGAWNGPLNETWELSGSTWTQVSTQSAPPPRSNPAMADDPLDSSVVLFGGFAEDGMGNRNDTWVWSSTPPIAGLQLFFAPALPAPGQGVAFSSFFRGGVGPYSFSWVFGDGNVSSTADPVTSFGRAGFYEVLLWVNDSAEHTAYASSRVQVYVPLSVVSFVASPNPAVVGETVVFTVAASGGSAPYTYAWTFGDGGTGGNLSSIEHIYTTDGPFTTEVSVTDAVGVVVHDFIDVAISLQALAAASISSGGSPVTVTFVGQGQGGAPPYSFAWNFGDGSTSALEDPQHTYTSAGLFDVKLDVADSRGNHSSTTLVIRIGGGPEEWTASDGVYALIGAAAMGGVAAISVGAFLARQRARRREGEEWVKKLTTRETPENRPPP